MKVADETVTTLNAGASMLGYLYQARVALLWAIRQSRVGLTTVRSRPTAGLEEREPPPPRCAA